MISLTGQDSLILCAENEPAELLQRFRNVLQESAEFLRSQELWFL